MMHSLYRSPYSRRRIPLIRTTTTHHQTIHRSLSVIREFYPQTTPQSSSSSFLSLRSFSSTPSPTTDEEQHQQQQSPSSPNTLLSIDGSILRHAVNRNPHHVWDAVGQVATRKRLRRLYPLYYDFFDHPPEINSSNSSTTMYADGDRHRRTGASPRVLTWTDQLHHIVATASLLETSTSNSTIIWTDEQWQQAEHLLANVWTVHETIRSVILQFALYQQCWVQTERTPQKPQRPWLSWPKVLVQLLNNWRVVYGAQDTGAAGILDQAGLGPEQVLDSLVRERPTLLTEQHLHFILDASSSSTETTNNHPEFADKVLQTCVDLWQSGVEACSPNNIKLWNLALLTWVEADRGRETVQRVVRILEHMQQLQLPWNKISYHMAMRAWGSLRSTEGAEKAERLLHQLCSAAEHGVAAASTDVVTPDVYAFTMVSKAWADSQSPHAGPRMAALYQTMQDLRSQGKLYGDPSFDAEFINSILECYKHALDPTAAAYEAERFWRSTGHAADNITYIGLIALYCRANKLRDLKRLLNEMQDKETELNKQNYVSLFSALAKSNIQDKVDLADQVLESMRRKTHTHPDTKVYNAYLSILVTSLKKLRFKAKSILEEMKHDMDAQPDKITYTIVMNGFARNGDVKRAAELLRVMYDTFDKTGNRSIAPDVQAFNTVLAGYAKMEKDDTAAEQAEAFLRDMRKIHDEGLLENIQPDVYTIASVLSCYANKKDNRGKSAGKAEDLLHEAKDWGIKPNHICFNNVMDAWARAGYPNRAENMFLEMCEDYKHGNENARPDASSFNILIKAWALSKKPESVERVEQILQQMTELAAAGEARVAPNVRTYTAVVTCYGLSKLPGAPQRAESLVHRMDQLHREGKLAEGPSKRTFLALQKAWTTSKEPGKAQSAARIDEEIRRRFG